MACHIIETESFGVNERPEFERIEYLVNSDPFDLYLCKCKKCEQLYLGCYREIRVTVDDEDHWNYWVPISEADYQQVRSDVQKAVEYIQARKRIVWCPTGEVFWSEFPSIGLMSL